MKMKRISRNIQWLMAAALLATGCKKEVTTDPAFTAAYTRFVFIDAPGNGNVQFLLDGIVNANGDSTLYNPDGTIYKPDISLNTTTLINYRSGGWSDNSPVNFSGTYGFSNADGSTFSTFPNPTCRNQLAPIIKGINYFNWASLPANVHQLSLHSVINSAVFGNPIAIRGDRFMDQPLVLEGGAVQTFFLVNKSVAKQYMTIHNNQTSTGLPLYQVGEEINFYSNQMDLVTVKDHPDKLPAFKDSSAYIRFINVTPAFADQSLNQKTDSLDIYIAPVYGIAPDMVNIDGGSPQPIQVSDSIGPERLVVKGLRRFQSVVDAPFFEIDVAPVMRIAGKIYTSPAAGEVAVPRYYRILAYRGGRSHASGDQPVAKGDWLAVFNKYPGYIYSQWGNHTPTGKDVVDSWLVRYNGTTFHPAICTIPIAVDEHKFLGVTASDNSNYLGYRSCINYQKAGVNDSYFP